MEEDLVYQDIVLGEITDPTNLSGFLVATRERWSGKEGPDLVHCAEHNTTFEISEEPCWMCYEEFNVRI